MTDDEINIEIYKSLGGKPGQYYCSQCRECVPIETVTSGGYHTKCGGKVSADVPRYTSNLNAMAEVEATMLFSVRQRYYGELREMWRTEIGHYIHDIELLRSTARQRAVASLRAKGLWK